MTPAERRLWSVIRQRQLGGFRFRRQHPMGPYIADFACLEVGLVIEVDGGQHDGSSTDGRREAFMRGKGFKVLRFWNNEVMANLEGVCSVIARCLPEQRPHPSLPPQAGEGAEQGD
jgi:very-short-patch-repair endonuclease